MRVRIKYRVHGAAEAVLHPGQIVELDEAKALELIRQGAAEELNGDEGSRSFGIDAITSAAQITLLHTALAAREAECDAAEKEASALRDAKTALEKQVTALKEALKKAKAKTPSAETSKSEGAQ